MAGQATAEPELEALADTIVERGLAVPAVFLLELHRPVASLGSQLLVVGSPLLAPMVGLASFERLRAVLADPVRYEAFLSLIETKARAADAAARRRPGEEG